MSDIDAAAWDTLAVPEPAALNPFVLHAFLHALERSGSVGAGTGWQPAHIALKQNGRLLAAAPLYVKTHSQGEYVFDHAWADAYHRAGGHYYPKLQCAVPFTPVPGPRLLCAHDDHCAEREALLARATITLAERIGASSVHVTFAGEDLAVRLSDLGFLHRFGQQFHFANPGYDSFDAFLAVLTSRKRKAIRRERDEARRGLTIRQLTGTDITQAHWDAFFTFYMDTGSRKWGHPYLNRTFFSMLGEALGDRCLLVLAEDAGRPIAGALNLIGGDCLYGRYWGAIEQRPFLHFELCYHQAIEYAIAHGLKRVEAGAQGDHKLARGYEPVVTHSAHWIVDAGLRAAVARYLSHERETIAEINDDLARQGPFRRT
ncbi:MAG: GNAT family N-acetyltransferase [Hyphomicrobiaceae bacterium]